jgi:hypothetical protein
MKEENKTLLVQLIIIVGVVGLLIIGINWIVREAFETKKEKTINVIKNTEKAGHIAKQLRDAWHRGYTDTTKEDDFPSK